MSETTTLVATEATTPAKPTAPKKATAKKSAKKAAKAKPKKAAAKVTNDGTQVGYKAKSKADCKWTPLKVEFYKALKRIGGEGTSEQIAKASKGKINAGHARHFGYHGVGGGYTKVEQQEDVRGFTFCLTAKGRSVDPDAMLKKERGE